MPNFELSRNSVECDRCGEVFTDESTYTSHTEADHGDKEEDFEEVADTYELKMDPNLTESNLRKAKNLLRETNQQELYHSKPFKNPKATIPTKLEPHNSADDLVAGLGGYNDDPNSFFYNNKNFKKGSSTLRTSQLGEAVSTYDYFTQLEGGGDWIACDECEQEWDEVNFGIAEAKDHLKNVHGIDSTFESRRKAREGDMEDAEDQAAMEDGLIDSYYDVESRPSKGFCQTCDGAGSKDGKKCEDCKGLGGDYFGESKAREYNYSDEDNVIEKTMSDARNSGKIKTEQEQRQLLLDLGVDGDSELYHDIVYRMPLPHEDDLSSYESRRANEGTDYDKAKWIAKAKFEDHGLSIKPSLAQMIKDTGLIENVGSIPEAIHDAEVEYSQSLGSGKSMWDPSGQLNLTEADNYPQKAEMTDNEWEKDLGDLKNRYETEVEDVKYDVDGTVSTQGEEKPVEDIPALESIDFGYEKYESYPTKATETRKKKASEVYDGIIDEYDRFVPSDDEEVTEMITAQKLQGSQSESIAKSLTLRYGVSREDALEKVYSIEVSNNDRVANTFFQKKFSECSEAEISELRLYCGSDE